MNDTLKNYIQKLRSPKILVVLGLAGILLIALSSFSGDTKKQKEAEKGEFSSEEYCAELQNDLKKLVREISGDRNATVVITLDSSLRYSYADTREESASNKTDDTAESSDSELKEGYILIKQADGGEQALLITAQMPEIRGVAIVCEGGDNEYIQDKIQKTVTSALNISSKRVYICGRNRQ